MKRVVTALLSIISLLMVFSAGSFAEGMYNPMTGDSGATLWIILAVAALLTMLILLLIKPKRNDD